MQSMLRLPGKAMKNTFRLFLALILLGAAGCSGFLPSDRTPVVQETLTIAPSIVPTQASTPTPSGSPVPPGPITLKVWLPPQFDPDSGTPAGNLLKARLEEFGRRRSGVRVDVRIKAVDGPGGLLDTLTTASAAAPLALPDLIALPRPLLETAALKGLLHPFDDLTIALEDLDWYEYARQLARLQSSTFGLPFAGDAMLLVYRPALVKEPPADWTKALATKGPLVFPAADPQALFTLALYQANGGTVRDDQGRPFLDSDKLAQVLTFYQDAEKSELMPYWLTQYQGDDQAWETFVDGRADMVVTWSSRFLSEMLADTDIAPIPTPQGTSYSLANGWVWALATSQPDRQELSAQLAEFLIESSFLAKWTQAAGYLPPRPSSLDSWSSTSLKSLVSQIETSARLYPSNDVVTSLGPALEQATVQVLKKQDEPLTAAQTAAQSLIAP